MKGKEMEDLFEDVFAPDQDTIHHPDLVRCYFCKERLHVNNNAMTRCMAGNEPAARGFGWITVIVAPFKEVPCCDVCMEQKENCAVMLMV
jgi:hypothetical protein